MVGGPEPVVLEVNVGRLRSNMHVQERSFTVSGDSSSGWALAELQVRSLPSANLGVHVPCTGAQITSQVPFDKNSSGSTTNSTNTHVGPFNSTSIAALTNLDNRVGVGCIRELVATAGNNGIALSHNLGARGDVDGVGDQVHAVVEKDQRPFGGSRSKSRVDSHRIVSRTVAFSTGTADADNLVSGVGLVLRFGLGIVVGSTRGNQTSRARCGSVCSGKSVGPSWSILVTLTVVGNSGRAAFEVHSTRSSNGSRNSVKNNVLQDQVTSTGRVGTRSPGSVDECVDVGNGAVDDVDTTDLLSVTVGIKRDTNLAIVEVDSDIGPAPVPELVDTGHGIIDGNVAHGELLVANIEALETSVDSNVTNESSRTYKVSYVS